MKRFLIQIILLGTILLLVCGCAASNNPERVNQPSTYVLLWRNDANKVIREETYKNDDTWYSTFEYEYDSDCGKRSLMRKLTEDDQEIFRTHYYYENGIKTGEDYYVQNVLQNKTRYDADENIIYKERFDENGSITSWGERLTEGSDSIWVEHDSNDAVLSVILYTEEQGESLQVSYSYDEEGYIYQIFKKDSQGNSTEVIDYDEMVFWANKLQPFVE